MSESQSSPIAPVESCVQPSRAAHLLDAMQKVFSHDLPNQMVVMQSLIGLLHEDETNLSADGAEHLRRLHSAAGKASQMVHFLKDMARLTKLSESIETLRLPGVARELQAELRQLYPDREIRLEATWHVPSVIAGRRSFQQALLHLLRCGVEQYSSQLILIHLSSTASSEASPTASFVGSELHIRVQPGEGPALPGAPTTGQDRTLPEKRLEYILARELLALSAASLAACPEHAYTFSFVIAIPAQVNHA